MKHGKLLLEYEIYKDDTVSIILDSIKECIVNFNFSNNDILKILTASKEAILNVIKYAHYGKFSLFFYEEKKYSYIQLISDDSGKGVSDIKLCMTRGYSTENTMGIGLNVILNSADEVKFHSKKDGFYVDMKMYLYDYRYHFVFRNVYESLEASMKVDPYDKYVTCGDGGIVIKNKDDLFFAHWDIEGHGSSSVYESSLLLKKYFFAFSEYELIDILSIVNESIMTHENFKRASLLIGKIDIETQDMSIYRLGNINYLIYDDIVKFKSTDSVGLLGLQQNIYTKEEFRKDEWDIFVSFSDGIQSTKLFTSLVIDGYTNSYEIVDKLINNFSKINDDSSLLVIKKLTKKENL